MSTSRHFTHPGSLGEHIQATNFHSSCVLHLHSLSLFSWRSNVLHVRGVLEGSWSPPVLSSWDVLLIPAGYWQNLKHQRNYPKHACPSHVRPPGNGHTKWADYSVYICHNRTGSSWNRYEIHEASSQQSISVDSTRLDVHSPRATVLSRDSNPRPLATGPNSLQMFNGHP